ncbi:MAG TPA: hypothetical protein VF316_17780 [Polyangiaceae bacterium]
MTTSGPISRAASLGNPESVRAGTRLVLLANDAMRARRRPFSVLAFALYQAAVGCLVAWPIAKTVGATFGRNPRGDAALFEEGGYALADWLRNSEDALAALTSLAVPVYFAGALLGLVPVISLFASIAHTTPDLRTPRARHLAPYVASTFAPMTALLVLSGALKILVVMLAAAVYGALASSLAHKLGEVRGDELALVAAALVALLVPMTDIVHDMARAALVRYRANFGQALRIALRAFARTPLRSLFSYAWRGAAAWVPILLVAPLATRFGGRAGLALGALFVLHQSVVFARAALRASWFAKALRIVDGTPIPRAKAPASGAGIPSSL